MLEKYQNKYRIPSARLKNWDYASNGAYFITICTKDRKHYFGEIANGEMHLSSIGKLAHQFWNEIPQHFPFVELGNFVIMPNHMHGILIIANPDPVQTLQCNVSAHPNPIQTLQCNISAHPDSVVQTLQCNISAHPDSVVQTLQCNVSTPPPPHPGNPEITPIPSPKPGSISTIIRSYKSVVTKNAHFINKQFQWHPRFHDHIIRNSESFEIIQTYIANNPKNWAKDTFSKRK